MSQVLIKEGSLPALVGSISSRELNCQRYSSLCLANLATTVAAQVKIIQCGAVRPLIAMGMNPANQIEARRYAVLALASKLSSFFNFDLLTALFVLILHNCSPTC